MAQPSHARRVRRDSIPRPPLRERFTRTYLVNAWVQALCLRRWRRPVPGRITVVSPDYTGNVAALGEYLRRHHRDLEVLYLPHHTGAIGPTVPVVGATVGSGIKVLSPRRFRDMMRVARSTVVVTAWGSGNLRPWLHRKHRPRFADAWHGVGFKAAMISQPGRFRRYDAIFAPSEHIAQLYREARMNAVATGYARTDVMLAAAAEPARSQPVRDLLTASAAAASGTHQRRIVLFAPTWSGPASDNPWCDRSLFDALDAHAARHHYVVAVRPHPVAPAPDLTGLDHVVLASTAAVPATEVLLSAVDALVTDWSSIATDYLALDRPVIYLDTPEPGPRLFPLQAEDRPGAVVATADQLIAAVDEAVLTPTQAVSRYREQRAVTLAKAWGSTLDGHSAQRCLQELRNLGIVVEET